MDNQVLIAGGGPVGLMLACELRLAGVDVTVLEGRTDPDLTVKAGSINVPTAEACYRRGLLPALAEHQRRAFEQMAAFMARTKEGGQPRPGLVGHFAGIMVGMAGVDVEDPAFRDCGPAGDVRLVNQQAMEEVLGERAAELGVRVRRGVEVVGFAEAGDGDGVLVETTAGTVETGWLVGCDGGRSVVRKLAGFDFPGTDPEITGRQAIVDLTGADELPRGWNRTDTGVYAYGPMPGRVLTVEFDGPPTDRDAPITAAEIEGSLRRVTGVDVTVTAVHSATRYTDNARQASTYRKGRVLLAGDAAHVHSPFGGQGLNLGVGDAVNLGWKLAAVVRGHAPDGLLDTYTSERHPIGEWVLDWNRAQVALMRTDRRSRALQGVVSDLLAGPSGATYIAVQLSGVWQRYDLGGGHPLVGSVAPDIAFTDGARLADLCHDGRPLLLDLGGLDTRVAEPWGARVHVVAATPVEQGGPTGLLVRPDGYVSWAADDGTATGLTEALSALSRPAAVPVV